MDEESEHHEMTLPNIKKYITPPNPIINKEVFEPELSSRPMVDDIDSDEESEMSSELYTLFAAYYQRHLIFIKWSKRNTLRNGVNFYASHFFDRYEADKFAYEGHLSHDALVFNSNYESANLLAVYKIKDGQYDLIMQNDTNSSGYTQWFNFMVSNGRHRGTVRFNIVNFYKRRSLFGQGLKPLSKSMIYDKSWKRSCHNVKYLINEIRMQGRKGKYYKTLSFSYDFVFDNDTVQFSSSFPYTHETLNSWIAQLSSPKLRVKYLGATPLKKILPMLHISAESGQQKYPKRAIVLMGRQHPGETASSFIIQTMVEELLGYTSENDFLLSKFQVFVFPMVNVDGVVLGNYRCNTAGYDLNRYWHLEQCKKTPQIFYIKSELKKIMKKMSIQLILDFHGHSTKMNSFFYGNNFGKYNMVFPYIAAKIEPNIDFSSCNFTDEEKDKAKTARVILGNMIRQTGAVYTYQVSLFGFNRNGKKTHFLLEHYQDLGRSLLAAACKCEMEIYKEEKSLKESLFLKDIRRDLKKLQSKVSNKEESGSDEEAKKTTQIEENAKRKKVQTSKQSKQLNSEKQLENREKKMRDAAIQCEIPFCEHEYRMIKAKKEPSKLPKKDKISLSIQKIEADPENRKEFLLNKLRIFGQNVVQDKTPLYRPQQSCFYVTSSTQTAISAQVLTERQQKLIATDRGSLNLFNLSVYYGKALSKQGEFRRSPMQASKSNTSGVVSREHSFDGLIKYSKLALA